MMNLLMLFAVATGAAPPGAYGHAQVHPQADQSLIVVHSPKGGQGDTRICDGGRVLADPVRHPKSCFDARSAASMSSAPVSQRGGGLWPYTLKKGAFMTKQILVAWVAATMVAVACPMASNAGASAVEAAFPPNGRAGSRYSVPRGSEVFA